MAKGRVRNRMELRDQYEAAEARERAEGEPAPVEAGADGAEATVKPAKKRKAAATKEPRSRKKTAKVVRQRIVWVVLDNSAKKVMTFEYTRRQEAYDYAERMQAEKKTTYFVQPLKEPIPEEKA